MSSDEHPDLTRAALLASRSSRLIAGLLPTWERAFGQTAADYLGTTAPHVTSLALCLRPSSENWAAHISELAAACSIDEARLSTFLRQAMSVERLASAPPIGDVVDGRLMAARDRTDDEQ